MSISYLSVCSTLDRKFKKGLAEPCTDREAAFRLKTVKRMLYLGYVLLRCVLIYNLEVSFNFRLLFLQLNVIKMFTLQ